MSGDGWIGVDFDGTLVQHETGSGVETLGKPVIPMLARVMDWLDDGEEVRIFTARADDPEQVEKIQFWLKKQGLPELAVTNKKDPAMKELWDDKAVTVEKNTGRLALLALRVAGVFPPKEYFTLLEEASRLITDAEEARGRDNFEGVREFNRVIALASEAKKLVMKNDLSNATRLLQEAKAAWPSGVVTAAQEIVHYNNGLPYEELTTDDNIPFTISAEEPNGPHPKWQDRFHLNDNLITTASRTLRLATRLLTDLDATRP